MGRVAPVFVGATRAVMWTFMFGIIVSQIISYALADETSAVVVTIFVPAVMLVLILFGRWWLSKVRGHSGDPPP